MTERSHILIVAPSWVGDAVLSQPLLRRLKARNPSTVIDVLAAPWTRAVYERMPEVSAVHDLPFAHGELALHKRYTLGRSLAQHAYTQAYVLPNSLKSALVPFFARIPRRTGYVGEARWGLVNDARRLDQEALPLMIERFAALAEDAGPAAIRPLAKVSLRIDPAARSATLLKLGLKAVSNIAVLCPGAEYGPAKRWPVEYFGALAQRFDAAGWQVWIAGSAKDATVGAEIVTAAGRHALTLDTTRYDVIEADAILPKTALSGLLNSQEFFQQVRSKLAPGGLYVQWAPTERSVETFRSVFPYVTMMHPALIGSDRPIPFSREKILERLAGPEIDRHMAAAGVDRAELRKWFQDKKIEVLNDGKTVPAKSPNTDFFPRDEYYLNRP